MAFSAKFAAVGLIALGLYGCSSKDSTSTPVAEHPVYVVSPQPELSSASRTFTAAVEEGKSVNVSFKTGGQIKRLLYKEGDKVAKGTVLGKLDAADYKLQLHQVETQYEQVSTEVKRLEEMYRRNNIAANDYEKAKAGLEQLKAQLELLQNQVAYTTLEAPVSGYIVEKYMEEGEMTGAGTPIYKILDNSILETRVALPASVYARKADIVACVGKSTASGKDEIPLQIISFVPDGDNNSLFSLRLRIPAEYRDKLLPGMNMMVAIKFTSGDGERTHTVPSRAVFEREGREYVWSVDMQNFTLSAKEVARVGLHKDGNTSVMGLNGDETLVAAGVHHLSDDVKVKVIGDIKTLKEVGSYE